MIIRKENGNLRDRIHTNLVVSGSSLACKSISRFGEHSTIIHGFQYGSEDDIQGLVMDCGDRLEIMGFYLQLIGEEKHLKTAATADFLAETSSKKFSLKNSLMGKRKITRDKDIVEHIWDMSFIPSRKYVLLNRDCLQVALIGDFNLPPFDYSLSIECLLDAYIK